MSDLFATDEDEIDEVLTAAVAEIFWRYGFGLPPYVGITITGSITLRPTNEGKAAVCLYGNAH